MEWFDASGYWLARFVFTRVLGAIFVVAFLNVCFQWRPLLGEDGLLPVPRFLRAVSFRDAPSVFHWRYSDRLAIAIAWFGVALSAALTVGLPQQGPAWLGLLGWLVVWLLYMSFVNVGQIFYAFGWESILLEAGFFAAFLGSEATAPPLLAILLLRWLLFRVEFGAGLIKLRGDSCWRNFTCLYYHHETQPLPNPLSRLLHHLPEPLHRAEVGANYVAQLIAPFGLFAPQPVAGIAGGVILVSQGWLVLSGNFSWLNVLTMSLAVLALPDAWLPWSAPADLGASPVWLVVAVGAVTVAVVVMSYWPVKNMASRSQRMNQSFNQLHLVNTYGAFGSITKQRFEVVVEGTTDPSGEGGWREYEFKGKPTDPARRPAQIAPYHLRLDWLMWFAAMSSPRSHPWFLRFVRHLLAADEKILGLLRHDPFDGEPPARVRARRYRYRFTTRRERRETSDWWVREHAGEYLPALSRDDLADREATGHRGPA